MLWSRKGMKTSLTLKDESPNQGISPGRPRATKVHSASLLKLCPTGALVEKDNWIRVDEARCIRCQLCRQHTPPMEWDEDFHWAKLNTHRFPHAFRHSLHIRVIDAGNCGACLNEIHQLSSPVYSFHRFGISITPTPREADVLMVVGPVTIAMKTALEEAYEAMPTPKRVLAVGACALSGGLFASSFSVVGPVSNVIPVDVEISGCPPPPLAILDGLRQVMGVRLASDRER